MNDDKETLERLSDPEVQEALRLLKEKGITHEQIQEAYEWLDQYNSETRRLAGEQSVAYQAKRDARGNVIRLDWAGAHKIQHLHAGAWTHTFWVAQIEVNHNKVGVGKREEGTDQHLDCDIDFAMFGTREGATAFARDYLVGEGWNTKGAGE